MNVLERAYAPGGLHAAALVRVKGGCRVWMDGRLGPVYPGSTVDSLVFSPDGRHFAYEVFVTDPKKSATARSAAMVVDGRLQRSYDLILNGSGTFSSTGGHFAYAALDEKRWVVVVDGRPRLKSKAPIRLSPDRPGPNRSNAVALTDRAEHVACVVSRPGGEAVLTDAGLGQTYDRVDIPSLTFSPNGAHLTYRAKRGETPLVVTDGHPGPPGITPWTDPPQFLPASGKVVYGAQRGQNWHVYIGDSPGPGHDALMAGSLTVAPGDHLAYAAQDGGKWSVLWDGKIGPAFDGIGNGTLQFSPDGRHLAYGAKEGNRWRMMVDHRSVFTADGLVDFTYSPDSTHYAFAAQTAGPVRVYREGRAGDGFEGVGPLRFSRDGKHLAYAAKLDKDRFVVVVDEKRTPVYENIGQDGPSFNEDGSLEFLGVRAGRLYRVRVSPPDAP